MCFISNLVTGRKLIWVNSSTLPRLGITDWNHIEVITVYFSISQYIYCIFQHITSQLRDLLHIEKPYWNRSITLPYRCDMGVFLEQKSQTGQYGDQLKFEPFKNETNFN